MKTGLVVFDTATGFSSPGQWRYLSEGANGYLGCWDIFENVISITLLQALVDASCYASVQGTGSDRCSNV